MLMLGCAVVDSDKSSGSDLFASYNEGDNPERYCEKPGLLTAGQTTAECVHELIVFDRARRACANSEADRLCVSHNQTRWQQEVAKADELVRQLAGDDFNAENFHQQMRRQAERFVIHCKNNSGEQVMCSSR